MKIYVSGTYTAQARLREEAAKLHSEGHVITSTWLQEVDKPGYLYLNEWYRSLALKDLAEVAAADCIILDLDGTSSTGGRYVEWGFAVGRWSMLKLAVGASCDGVFNTLADETFHDWDDVRQYLKIREGK